MSPIDVLMHGAMRLPDAVAESVTEKDGQLIGPKGAVYSTAIIGGVLGAKDERTDTVLPPTWDGKV